MLLFEIIEELDFVKNCSVIVVDDLWLMAFVALLNYENEGSIRLENEINETLQCHLPDYSRPNLVVTMTTLPVNRHGRWGDF